MTRFVSRFGQQVEPDAVFDATASGSLDAMRSALPVRTNAVDRHYLLHSLVRALYQLRTEPGGYDELVRIGRLHMQEMPVLFAGLLENERREQAALCALMSRRSPPVAVPPVPEPELPVVETFLLLVRAMCEVADYDSARDVWRSARTLGYLTDEGLAAEIEGVERRRRKNDRAAKKKQA